MATAEVETLRNPDGPPAGLPLRSKAEIAPDLLAAPVYAIREIDHIDRDNCDAEYWWIAEGIWFTRAEAEAWMSANRHHLTDRAHVWSYPARGNLRELLIKVTVDDSAET